MMAFDPFWWWSGRRYGEAIAEKLAAQSPRTARRVVRGRSGCSRAGSASWTVVLAYYLPVPNNLLYALAGWKPGFGLLRFIVLDLIGTMLYTTLGVGLGYLLGSRAAHVAGLISRYSIAATVALVVGLILVAWWRNRRGGAAPVAEADGQDPGDGAAGQAQAQTQTRRRNRRGHGPAQLVRGRGPPGPRRRRGGAGSGSDGVAAAPAGRRRGTVPGLVYAVVTPGGTATGQLSRSGGQPLGPHVMLEIGSVTKVFTALLLADSAERGEVQLDDPIARHLPSAVAQSCPAASRITLRQLATHTSGLPRLPRNLLPAALLHLGDPYARYSTRHLQPGAAQWPARHPPKVTSTPTMEFGLLGHLLGRAAGRPYAELLAHRGHRAAPGLTETGVGVPSGHVAATRHRRGGPACASVAPPAR